MTVAERAREVGLLRAAGATRRQVNGLVLVQAVILGLAGSLVGVVVGLGLAAVVGLVRAGAPGSSRSTARARPAGAVLVAVAVGTLVTLAAAVEPAVRAGRISPVDALRPAGAGPAVRARLRWLVVVFVVLAAAGLVLRPGDLVRRRVPSAGWRSTGSSSSRPCSPRSCSGRSAGSRRYPFGLVAPAASRLARGALVRDRGRTTLTVGALTVGLAMIVALGGLAQDARRAATAWVAGVVPGDLVATSIRPVALDEPVVDALAGSPGVARVSPIGAFEVAFRGHPAPGGRGDRRRSPGRRSADPDRGRPDRGAQRARRRRIGDRPGRTGGGPGSAGR